MTFGARELPISFSLRPVCGHLLPEIDVVLLAQLRRGGVVQEGQESVSPSAPHLGDRVEQRAGEHDGSARRRLERARANSGKLTSPPVNSALRLIETAKRRCAVPLVVLSRWARKCAASRPRNRK